MSGVSNKTMTDGLLLSVFIASSMSGWSGCFSLRVCVADQCLLLYNGLTQGQGHTVRQWSCVEGSSVKESGELIRVSAPKVQGSGVVLQH